MSHPGSEAVLFDVSGGVATITLNRPEQLNAINADLSRGLAAALQQVRERDDVRVAILTGQGRAFCAGADLKARVAADDSMSGGPASLFGRQPPAPFAEFDPRKPVIGAINGYCLGGGFEMALNCDLMIAADNAQFALPEITLGFFPGGGAPVRLPRFIPHALANDLLFTGERIDAATALRYGIVSRVVPADQLATTAGEMATRIAGFAPLAVRAMLELIRRQGDLPIADALRLGSTMRWAIGQTEDAKEGPRAFGERRTPEFKGR